jgi:hypothetical protein
MLFAYLRENATDAWPIRIAGLEATAPSRDPLSGRCNARMSTSTLIRTSSSKPTVCCYPNLSGFANVSQQEVDFGKAIIEWIDNHVIVPVKGMFERGFH